MDSSKMVGHGTPKQTVPGQVAISQRRARAFLTGCKPVALCLNASDNLGLWDVLDALHLGPLVGLYRCVCLDIHQYFIKHKN